MIILRSRGGQLRHVHLTNTASPCEVGHEVLRHNISLPLEFGPNHITFEDTGYWPKAWYWILSIGGLFSNRSNKIYERLVIIEKIEYEKTYHLIFGNDDIHSVATALRDFLNTVYWLNDADYEAGINITDVYIDRFAELPLGAWVSYEALTRGLKFDKHVANKPGNLSKIYNGYLFTPKKKEVPPINTTEKSSVGSIHADDCESDMAEKVVEMYNAFAVFQEQYRTILESYAEEVEKAKQAEDVFDPEEEIEGLMANAALIQRSSQCKKREFYDAVHKVYNAIARFKNENDR